MLIARPAHVAAVRAGGLRLRTGDGDYRLDVPAVDSVADAGPFGGEGGDRYLRRSASDRRALAATNGLVSAHVITDSLSRRQRAQGGVETNNRLYGLSRCVYCNVVRRRAMRLPLDVSARLAIRCGHG